MAYLRLKERFENRAITFENHVPPDLPRIKVDHKRFSRLFDLLLEDEIVSLPRGSLITVRARMDESRDGVDSVRLEVEDNGPGLPPDALQLLFNPFMVRSDSPSEYGIRLMACFFIVHQHGGKIIARSQEGKGTTFLLRIPLDPAGLPLETENQMFLEKLFFDEERFESHLSAG
jgi:signal transduction histidine kinase